jgi:hypothetical protein
MKIGDSVLYSEQGQDYVATVLEIRNLDNHLGSNGEPLLHLGFFAQKFKPGANGLLTRASIAGTHEQYDLAQFRFDVAHISHSFDPKLKLPTYPGGRYREVVISEPVVAGSGSERWYGQGDDWTKTEGAGLTDDTSKSSDITDSSEDISDTEGTIQ